MSEGLLRYAIPTMTAIVFVNFFCAWILTAVKPPVSPEDQVHSGETDDDWKYMDAGPKGIRKNIVEEVKPKIKRASS